jgi:hypothetical protein
VSKVGIKVEMRPNLKMELAKEKGRKREISNLTGKKNLIEGMMDERMAKIYNHNINDPST